MEWSERDEAYRLTSGRHVRVHDGILGISPDPARGPRVWAQFDRTISPEELPLADRQELARYAIALWKDFARAL